MITLEVLEDEYLELDVKSMPVNSPNDPRYPQIASLLEMDERDNKGERIEGKIELGFERKEGEERKYTKNT